MMLAETSPYGFSGNRVSPDVKNKILAKRAKHVNLPSHKTHLFRVQRLDDDVAVMAKGNCTQQVLQHGPHEWPRQEHRPSTQPQDLGQCVAHRLQEKVARLHEFFRDLVERHA